MTHLRCSYGRKSATDKVKNMSQNCSMYYYDSLRANYATLYVCVCGCACMCECLSVCVFDLREREIIYILAYFNLILIFLIVHPFLPSTIAPFPSPPQFHAITQDNISNAMSDCLMAVCEMGGAL